jgi:hypothetical protein
MADKVEVQLGENSPEYVAFRLFSMIQSVEGRSLSGSQPPDRGWILKTYSECIMAVRHASYA